MPTINGRACVVNGTPVDKVFSDGRQVYGRNLYKGSHDSSWVLHGKGSATIKKVTMDSGEVALHVISPDDNSGAYFSIYFPSGTYTVSVDVKGTGTVDRLGWENISEAGVTLNSNWQRVSITGLRRTGWQAFIMYGMMDIYVRLLKGEKGTISTPWTPAPEDVLKI